MSLSDRETEDKSWQQSSNLFQPNEEQFVIKTELKQEYENKIWQKDCSIFERECLPNEQEDVFGELIKQIEENRNSKKQNDQFFLAKTASPEKCSKTKKKRTGNTENNHNLRRSEMKKKKVLDERPIHPGKTLEKESPERCPVGSKKSPRSENLIRQITSHRKL